MAIFFDPGQMTAWLDLEAPQAEPDGQGGATVTWQALASVWARIEPVSFTLAQDLAGAESAKVSHRIWIRHRDDVAAGQRLRKGTRIFAINLARDPDETGRYLVCQCVEEAR